jgi:hypothetical protein
MNPVGGLLWASSIVVLFTATTTIQQQERFTLVEVNVDPPLSVAVYAHHPAGKWGKRICSQVSQFEKCRLPWTIASPSSGVILRVKPLAYPDCPLVRPEFVSEICYNTDVIYFSENSIIVLNVRYPLQFSSYFLKEPR